MRPQNIIFVKFPDFFQLLKRLERFPVHLKTIAIQSDKSKNSLAQARLFVNRHPARFVPQTVRRFLLFHDTTQFRIPARPVAQLYPVFFQQVTQFLTALVTQVRQTVTWVVGVDAAGGACVAVLSAILQTKITPTKSFLTL